MNLLFDVKKREVFKKSINYSTGVHLDCDIEREGKIKGNRHNEKQILCNQICVNTAQIDVGATAMLHPNKLL